MNLTYHETDFGIVAVWISFATSHGKSPCDGLGEAVKRKLTNVSLERPLQDQIVTPQKCYTEAQALTPSVMFLFIPRLGVELTRHYLSARFECGDTVPGTRSFHMFVPQRPGAVSYKQCAEDEDILWNI